MLNRRMFVTGLSAAAVARVAWSVEMDDDHETREILRQRVDIEKRTVGMAVCVVTPRGQRFVAWGRERLGGDRQISPETVFEIGSLTKVFTALLLADMVRRGEMELDDPVSRHLPDNFHVPQFESRQITLADLATHTSGLPRFPPYAGTPLSAEWVENVARYSMDDLRTWLATVRVQHAPGTEWEYSNVGFVLLGAALAHRGDRSYEALLRTRIIEPLGLQDTTFGLTSAMSARLAEGHDAMLKPAAPFDGGILTAAGGLRSTPRDLSRFAAAILGGTAAVITPDERLLLSVQRPAPAIDGMQALAWETLGSKRDTFVSKDGVTWGQAASMVFDPKTRVAIVVLSNTTPDLRMSSASGGGVGAADLARHLLRPSIPLSGKDGTHY